jgi:hypothetical protein
MYVFADITSILDVRASEKRWQKAIFSIVTGLFWWVTMFYLLSLMVMDFLWGDE